MSVIDVAVGGKTSIARKAGIGRECPRSGHLDQGAHRPLRDIASRPKLVGFDAQLFDDRAPFVQLRFEKRGQLSWCRASGNRANVCKSLLRLRMGNRSGSIDVYLSNDLSRGLGRQEKCVPERYVKSGNAGLGNGWNVRQKWRSHAGGYGQCADRAAINQSPSGRVVANITSTRPGMRSLIAGPPPR
jgi:hypothetical protein